MVLQLNNKEKPPVRPSGDSSTRIDYSLDTLVPDNPNKPYDIKELIVKVVDDGDFFELQPDYAGIGFTYRSTSCSTNWAGLPVTVT